MTSWWQRGPAAKGDLKMHVSLDEAKMVPDFIHLTPAKVSNRRGVDHLRYPKGTIIVDDQNHFVPHIPQSIGERDLPDGTDQHILKAELIQVTLRRVAVYKGEAHNVIAFDLTNNLEWPAATIGDRYKRRWQIDVFFKLLKQHRQINTCLGTSENACKSQVLIAMIVYLLVELARGNMSVWACCCVDSRMSNPLSLVGILKIRVQKVKQTHEPPDKSQKYWFLGNFFIPQFDP